MNRRFTTAGMRKVLASNMGGAQKLLTLRALEYGMVFSDFAFYRQKRCSDFLETIADTGKSPIYEYVNSCLMLASKSPCDFIEAFPKLVLQMAERVVKDGLLPALNMFMKNLCENHLGEARAFPREIINPMMLLFYSLYEHIKEISEVEWLEKFKEDGSMFPTTEIGFVGRSLRFYELMVGSVYGHDDLKLLELRYVEEALACGYSTDTISVMIDFAYGQRYYFKEYFDLSARSMKALLPIAYYAGNSDFMSDCIKPFLKSSRSGAFEFHGARRWWYSASFKELLTARNYKLPAKGVSADFLCAGDVKSLYMKEVFVDNKVILLWRVECFDYSTFGYFDTETQYFFSEFLLSCDYKRVSHASIESFVLECYAQMVCDDMDVLPAEESKMVVLKNEESIFDYYFRAETNRSSIAPIVKYDYEITSEDLESSDALNRKLFTIEGARNFSSFREVEIGVNIRKLPEGWVASEKSKALARMYGYELLPGYTFVGAFTKKVPVK